jgi:exodeoxyribonuclease-3
MRVMTWNINSVRLRTDLLLGLLDAHKPDVFCLQETKTPDEFFPVDALVARGFPHYHFAGMKGYNGVAIFSRHPLEQKEIHNRCGKGDMRHISARVKGKKHDFDLHNIYIPAGGYDFDMQSEKFLHKLSFVDELAEWFPKKRGKADPMVIVGDLNIAPLENDVWDHKKMLKVVSHTPIEVEKFTRLYKSMDFADAVRHFVPEDQKVYTWWSYRAADWDTADRGRRLDHVWVTQKLKPALKSHEVLRPVRGMQQPSDHVPIIVDLK